MSSLQIRWGRRVLLSLPCVLTACVTSYTVTGPVVPVPGVSAAPAPPPVAPPAPAPPMAPVAATEPTPPAIWSARMDYRRIGLEQFTQGRGIEVNRMSDDRLRLRMSNAFAFPNQDAQVSPDLRDLLVRLCASVRKDEPIYITITSHPDSSRPPDTAVALTQERTRQVAAVLSQHGIPAERIQLQSWGPGALWAVPDKLDIAVRDASPPR